MLPGKVVIQVKATEAERDRLREIADLNHQTVVEFIKTAVNEAAGDCDPGPPVFRILEE